MLVATLELIQKLKEVKPNGFEVSLRMGILTSTKAIYLKKHKYYLFAADQIFEFDTENGYSENQFKNKYHNWVWKIEQTIG